MTLSDLARWAAIYRTALPVGSHMEPSMPHIEARRMFFSWTHAGILTGQTTDSVGYYPARNGGEAPRIVAVIRVHHQACEEEIAQAIVDAHRWPVPGCPCRPSCPV